MIGRRAFATIIATAGVVIASITGGSVAAEASTRCSVTITASHVTRNLTAQADRVCVAGNHDVVNTLAGNDVVFVTGAYDVVNTGLGADTVTDSGAGDTISTGAGTDTVIDSGAGDTINTGADADTVTDSGSSDTVSLGDGNDSLNASAATGVTADGGTGNDVLTGSPTTDTISGGDGNDTISAGSGSDTVDGGPGNDSLSGGAGNDTITGDDGSDTVSGGDGNDTITGGSGGDTLDGNAGANTCDPAAAGDSVQNCVYDNQGPLIVSVSVDHSTVDTTNSAAVVNVSMHLTDNLSGIDRPTCGIEDYDAQYFPFTHTTVTQVSGTSTNGVWNCQLTLPQGSPGGTYELDVSAGNDFAGNQGAGCMWRWTANYCQFNAGNQIDLPAITDSSAAVLTHPRISSISADTTSVSTADSSQTIHFRFHVTDPGFDLGYGACVLIGPEHNGSSPTSLWDNNPQRVSGTARDGDWTCDVTLTQGSAQGKWRVYFQMRDWEGNDAGVTGNEDGTIGAWYGVTAPGAGSVAYVTVTSPGDGDGPVLANGLSFSTRHIDTATGLQHVIVTAHYTDATGVDNARCIATKDSNDSASFVTANAVKVSGTVQDGTYQCDLAFPAGSSFGTWNLWMIAIDSFGNQYNSGLAHAEWNITNSP